jgi:hypothetical protein
MNHRRNFRYLLRKIKGVLCDMVRMVGSWSWKLLVFVAVVVLLASMALQLVLNVRLLVGFA